MEQNTIPEITDDIKKASNSTHKMGSDVTENDRRYQNWIETLTAPFKKKGYGPCFSTYTQLTEEGRKILCGTELLRIDFPTNLSGLYRMEHENYDPGKNGTLIISKDDKARLCFPDYPGAYDDGEVYSKEPIEGGYRDIVKKYFNYLSELMYAGYSWLDKRPGITKASITFRHEMHTRNILHTLLPDWIDEARFNAKSISFYLIENYVDIDKHILEKGMRPFLFICSERDDNYRPKRAKKIGEISCKYGEEIQNSQIIESVIKKVIELIGNDFFMKNQKEKFKVAYRDLWQLGQGDGISNMLKVDSSTFYYFCNMMISIDYHVSVA